MYRAAFSILYYD